MTFNEGLYAVSEHCRDLGVVQLERCEARQCSPEIGCYVLRLEQNQITYVDEKTGLPNKHALEKRKKELDERVERDGLSLLVGYIDLTNFKAVNSLRRAHDKGDEVIAKIGQEFNDCFRDDDEIFLSRLYETGDEFIILCSSPRNNISDIELATTYLDKKVKAAVAGAVLDDIELNEAGIEIGATTGFVFVDRNLPPDSSGSRIGAAISRADQIVESIKRPQNT